MKAMLIRNIWIGMSFITLINILVMASIGRAYGRFQAVQTQFIAALGNPGASAGSGADQWGIWRLDPGPRGVRLEQYSALERAGGVAPLGGWQFDPNDWLARTPRTNTGDMPPNTLYDRFFASLYQPPTSMDFRWLEEHGLIMEKPDIPLPVGRYVHAPRPPPSPLLRTATVRSSSCCLLMPTRMHAYSDRGCLKMYLSVGMW